MCKTTAVRYGIRAEGYALAEQTASSTTMAKGSGHVCWSTSVGLPAC